MADSVARLAAKIHLTMTVLRDQPKQRYVHTRDVSYTGCGCGFHHLPVRREPSYVAQLMLELGIGLGLVLGGLVLERLW